MNTFYMKARCGVWYETQSVIVTDDLESGRVRRRRCITTRRSATTCYSHNIWSAPAGVNRESGRGGQSLKST